MAAGQTFLQELRDFLQFLGSLWGVLAAAAVLFPLSNTFFAVIPAEGDGHPFRISRPQSSAP